MNKDRRRLILDHLHGLVTLSAIAEELGVCTQRVYQIKQQLFKDYRIPWAYWEDGPAAARWVAAHDIRYAPPTNTPAYFYNNERWR